MSKSLLTVALLAAVALVSACSRTQIYPSSPFVDHPNIRTIAVAPFIIADDVAMVQGQSFPSMTYTDPTDGATIHYSEAFAQAFAQGVGRFPGMTVIAPAMVSREWAVSRRGVEAKLAELDAERARISGEEYAKRHKDVLSSEVNPLVSRDHALTIARSLRADAIIVGVVRMWDPYEPRMTVEWGLHYTNATSGSSANVRELERQGQGNPNVKRDLSKEAVFTESLTLDYNGASTQNMLRLYGNSLEETQPYAEPWMVVEQEPFPRFVEFGAWAGMIHAYQAWGVDFPPSK